ncbi:hypothetical protein CLAVI_000844 [Candidatus Clavichlamydia salmonicola]|uniref:hypothetical protein n=1 Tax=Candidatus Clavichlamydia salmonicola TaxID=469812 RepID=UPI001890EC44|nr:hypothetical protein [Candidatus Clavichlamydia salmonicola]MBF5051206.1 hypothetical protein [Candidatus Clavichlamydia salmonicola]
MTLGWLLGLLSGFLAGIAGWVSGLMSGVLSYAIGNDAQAIAQCRNTSFALKDLLDQIDHNYKIKNEKALFDSLKDFKRVVEKFSVEKIGLAFSIKLLDYLLQESLSIIRKVKFYQTDNLQQIHEAAEAVVHLWKPKQVDIDRFEELKGVEGLLDDEDDGWLLAEVQGILYRSLSGRFFARATGGIFSYFREEMKIRRLKKKAMKCKLKQERQEQKQQAMDDSK